MTVQVSTGIPGPAGWPFSSKEDRQSRNLQGYVAALHGCKFSMQEIARMLSQGEHSSLYNQCLPPSGSRSSVKTSTINQPWTNHQWTVNQPYINHYWTINQPWMNHHWKLNHESAIIEPLTNPLNTSSTYRCLISAHGPQIHRQVTERSKNAHDEAHIEAQGPRTATRHRWGIEKHSWMLAMFNLIYHSWLQA